MTHLNIFKKVHGLEEEPEGGERCTACFDYRLDKAAQKQLSLAMTILLVLNNQPAQKFPSH